MIKSTVYNVLAWVVLVVGFFLGVFAGFSADSLMNSVSQTSNSGSVFIVAMLVTWFIAFIIALILFYLSASLYHLEKINNNTSRIIELTESSQPTRIAVQTTPKINSSSSISTDYTDDGLKFRCMLCGKKHDGKDDVNVCPECKKLL